MFATGVALIVAGPSSRSTLLPIQKLSFFAWLAATGIHVLAYLQRVPLPLAGSWPLHHHHRG